MTGSSNSMKANQLKGLEDLFASSSANQSQKDRLSRFSESGFPPASDEYWKYTDLAKYTKKPFHISSSEGVPVDAVEFAKTVDASAVFYFVNGSLADSEGRAKSVKIEESESFEDSYLSGAMSDLNQAFQAKTFKLTVARKTVLDGPILLIHSVTTSASEQEAELVSPRVLIEVESQAQVQFVETHIGGAHSWVNSIGHYKVGQAAQVEVLKLISAEDGTVFIGDTSVSQARDSFFGVSTLTAGGDMVRQSYRVNQEDENADTECNGLYLSDGAEHVDHRVVMNHLKPHGRSRQLYKGVLKGKSRAIFNGKIYIEKDAQKIDSNQLNTNLILSKYAEADSKPELEVYADDVKANHGSAIGRLDEKQLFYLMSRAISRAEAIQFLAKGFVRDVTLQIRSKKLRELANDWLESSFAEFQKSIEEDAVSLGEKS